jgi:hypothetical protein
MIPGIKPYDHHGMIWRQCRVAGYRHFLRRSFSLRNFIIQKRLPGAVFAAGLFLYTPAFKSQAPERVFFRMATSLN